MPTLEATGAPELIRRLDNAVRLTDPHAITARIQRDLESLLGAGVLILPERFRHPREDTYARRLLHHDPQLGYSAVVMTWGPGQRTPLHDHAGSWCVEGVVEGEMDIFRYDLVAEQGEELYRFAPGGTVHARAGSAGALIPPVEHHVLANAYDDRIAVTLHVYQGEMRQCSIFEPVGFEEGLYRRRQRRLEYHP